MWHPAPKPEDPSGEAKFIRMMEDIHKLAVSPHGDALRISTFSGVVPPPKNEATFSQWVHEVRDALGRFPEPTVRNWITRSLRGAPAEEDQRIRTKPSSGDRDQEAQDHAWSSFPLWMSMMRRLFTLSHGKD